MLEFIWNSPGRVQQNLYRSPDGTLTECIVVHTTKLYFILKLMVIFF